MPHLLIDSPHPYPLHHHQNTHHQMALSTWKPVDPCLVERA
jgi:hypothetical protein